MKRKETPAKVPEKSRMDYGRSSPSYPLEEAVSFLKEIQGAIGTGDAAAELIAGALGHKNRTGSASVKIGTLTHFGLISTAGRGSYRVSELGLRVITPKNDEEQVQALAEAATTPTLYRDVFEKFKGHALPSLLHNILARDYHVRNEKATRVAEVFRKSMDWAGLLRNGVLCDVAGAAKNEEKKSEETQGASELEAATARSATDSAREAASLSSLRQSERSYSIPLSGGRICVLRIPLSIAKTDVDRIRSWVDLMAEVLIEKAADSESAASSMSQGRAEPPKGTPDGAST